MQMIPTSCIHWDDSMMDFLFMQRMKRIKNPQLDISSHAIKLGFTNDDMHCRNLNQRMLWMPCRCWSNQDRTICRKCKDHRGTKINRSVILIMEKYKA